MPRPRHAPPSAESAARPTRLLIVSGIALAVTALALLGGAFAAPTHGDAPVPTPPSGSPAAQAALDGFPAPEAGSAPILLRGGRLFDATDDRAEANPGVLVRGGRILAVGPADVPDDARVIDLEDDHTILPGLVDLHAHYNMNLTGDGRVEETEYNPLIYLANGVTSTFTGGEYLPEIMAEARRRIHAGERPGPRILQAGPYFGSSRPGWDHDISADSIRAEVDHWAARGVAGFKAKGAAPRHIEPLVDQAHRHGLTVTGHLESGRGNSTNSADAIPMGIDRVEHILGGPVLDPEQAAYPVWNQVDTASAEFREVVDLFLDNQVHFSATITAPVYFTELKEGFDDWPDEASFFTPHVQQLVAERGSRQRNERMSELYWTMRETTRAFYDAGGGDLIVLGTDNPSGGEFLPGFSAHRELHTMVLAGIPEASVLRIGTINGARALGMGDLLGTVETGKLADLFVVEGDPLEDITHTRNVELVLRNGELFQPDELLERARGRIGPEGPEEHDGWWERWLQ